MPEETPLIGLFEQVGFSRRQGAWVATYGMQDGSSQLINLHPLEHPSMVRLSSVLHSRTDAEGLIHLSGFIAHRPEPTPGVLWRVAIDWAAVEVSIRTGADKCPDAEAAADVAHRFVATVIELRDILAATLDCARQWDQFSTGALVRGRPFSPSGFADRDWTGVLIARGPVPGWIRVSEIDESQAHLVHGTYFEVLPEERLSKETLERVQRIPLPGRPVRLPARELRPGNWIRDGEFIGRVYAAESARLSMVTESGFSDLTDERPWRVHDDDVPNEVRLRLQPQRGDWARLLDEETAGSAVLVVRTAYDVAEILDSPEAPTRVVRVSSLVKAPPRLAPTQLRLIVGHFLPAGERQPLLPGTCPGSWVLSGPDGQVLRLVEARQTDYVALSAEGLRQLPYRDAQVISASDVSDQDKAWGEPAEGRWARVVGERVQSLHGGTLAQGAYGRVAAFDERGAVLELPGRVVEAVPMTMLLPVQETDVPWAWTLRGEPDETPEDMQGGGT